MPRPQSEVGRGHADLSSAVPPSKNLRKSHTASPHAREAARLLLPVVDLVAVYVAVEASKGLLANWENETKARQGLPRPWVPQMVFAKNVASVLTGIIVSLCLGGIRGVMEAIEPCRVLTLLPVAACFAASQVFALMALRHFDAGSLKVFSQLSLPVCALLSRVTMGRLYSFTQWQAIVFLVLCSIAFIEVRILFETGAPSPLELALGQVGGRHACTGADELEFRDALRPGGALEGLWYVLMSILLGSVASVLAERLLKHNHQPFYQQRCSLMIGECLAALLGMVLAGPSIGSHPAPERGIFSFVGWDWRTCLVVLVWLVHGWVAGLVVSQLTALTRGVAQILSATVSYGVATALWPRAKFYPRGIPATLAAAQVLLGVLIFATIRPTKDGQMKASSNAAAPEAQKLLPWRKSAAATRLAARARGLAQALLAKLVALAFGPAVLLFAFTLLEATRPLLVSWSQQGGASAPAFRNGTFVLAQTAVSFLVALAIALACERSARRAWRLCAEPRCVVRRIPVACCFTASKLALLSALAHLDAGTVRVLAQGGLPMVAVGSAMLGKKYSLLQWQAIWMIGFGVVTFFMVKTETERHALAYAALDRPWPPEAEEPRPSRARAEAWKTQMAIIYVFISLGCNCLGALVSERFLHSTSECTPYYAQKAHLLGGECVVNLGVCLAAWLCTPSRHYAGLVPHFAAGWDHRTVITMLVWIPSGWCATLVVRRCNALSKNIAQSASSLLTYIFSIRPVTLVRPALEPEPVVLPVVLLALVCLQSVVLFAAASAEEAQNNVRRQVKLQQQRLKCELASQERAPARVTSGSLPVLSSQGDNCHYGESLLCQIDNDFTASAYSVLRRPASLSSAPSLRLPSEQRPQGNAGGLVRMARVSTLGIPLCELAELDETAAATAAAAAAAATPSRDVDILGEHYPIGQTDDYNWVRHQS